MTINMVKTKDKKELNEDLNLDDLIDQLGKILAEEYIALMKEGEKDD